MKKNLRGLISVFVCIMLLFSASVPVFAVKNNNKNNSKGFKDVQKGHWAYDDIMWMLDRNIIEGVGNDTFSPDDTVTRAEFAKMMVNTLNLQSYSPDTPSFLDIKKNAWEYPYVESAKTYLTGFRTTSGDYFKPSQAAVREDMAVALVKALGYQNETVDESILNKFADAGQISTNLRKYVALSVTHGLIEGYTQNNQTFFGPQGNLTRAQSATLLHRSFINNEEKITYDENKITYDDNSYVRPVVSVTLVNNKLVVNWNKISSAQLTGYAVVISANDSTPTYPDNGYLYYITDINRTYAILDNSTQYSGSSDFGKYLEKDKKYYVSVTAIYKDKIMTGNTVQFQYNSSDSPESYIMPIVSASEENGKLVLRWNKIDSANLVSYRVVASKNDSTPSYPDNGYLYSITDRNRNYAIIDNTAAYTNGDFGGYFTKGQNYYFNVTAVYSDRYMSGNVIQHTYNGDDNPASYPAPVVSAVYEGGKLLVKWNKVTSPQLTEYRLVISKNNQSPVYPAAGYYNTPYDINTTSAAVDATKPYMNGDFSALTYGTEYYFSVTAVYNNNKYIAGNAVKMLYLIPANP